ncbi:hypothetical protein ACFPVT_05805 [Corynebacterium choanae]|uniref:Uncharacterized protein n=1 Tax=Corynebacterium choanae TaxID=1862358 RepID=A0A3G6J6Y4_9CORY|nr:hypothetical protein [Corynebacterium choanae]AZA13582.1 hypothetical protein CCHOA_05910 [Corynebacterium choanae]
MAAQQAHREATLISPALRAGGAFIVLAFVLFLTFVLHIVTQGFTTPFPVTVRLPLLLIAAVVWALFGSVGQRHTDPKRRTIVLVVVVAIIIASVLIPPYVLTVIAPAWLVGYGIVALLAGLILRQKHAAVASTP